MSDERTRVMSDGEMDAAEREAEARLAEGRTAAVDPAVAATVEEYLCRPYRIELGGDADEGYYAAVPDLPGCLSAGETPEEALRNLRTAMASWIEAAVLAGDPIPSPNENRHPGRMLVRMPRSLHARLTAEARQENVSTNQFAVMLLAEGVGQGRERLLVDLERALSITTTPPGPEREARRFLLQMVRSVLSGERWDLSTDAPGSENVAAINAYMRFLASLPPEVLDEIRRRLDHLFAAFASHETQSG